MSAPQCLHVCGIGSSSSSMIPNSSRLLHGLPIPLLVVVVSSLGDGGSAKIAILLLICNRTHVNRHSRLFSSFVALRLLSKDLVHHGKERTEARQGKRTPRAPDP